MIFTKINENPDIYLAAGEGCPLFSAADGSSVDAAGQDALDVIGDAGYLYPGAPLVFDKSEFCEAFFDLKTRLLGEVLQKFVNYGVRAAIVGDFSVYSSRSLRDFLYESNRGGVLYFAKDMAEAVSALSR